MNEQVLQWYRVFKEVAKVGNITAASKKLYISQPAVSSTITNLESSLGVTLFVRKSRGVELTEEGQLFYKHVSSAFEILERGESELRQFDQHRVGRLTIGISTTLCHFVLRPFLQQFIESHPNIELSLVNQSSYQTFSMLDQGTLDLGLTTEPWGRATVDCHPFMKYHYTFVTTPTYRNTLEQRGAQDVAQCFARGTTMLLSKVHPLRQVIDQSLSEAGLQTGHVIEVSNMDLLIDFSRMGMGIGYVIRNFVEADLAEGSLVELPVLKSDIDRYFCLSHAKGVPHNTAMTAFMDDFKAAYPAL